MKPHYERIRKVKTASGSTAVQVGWYVGKRFHVTKHIGSARETEKVVELVRMGEEYIRSHSRQVELNFDPHSEEILFKRGITVAKSTLSEAYSYLGEVYEKIGFRQLRSAVLKDFAIVRVLEPSSKARSVLLLKKYFDIDYKKTTVFRHLDELVDLKDEAVRVAIEYAREHLQFDFTLIFYDVTTLYFESFSEDELRRNGFSKDNKINQPQILIGLVVDRTGFPIYYDMFAGNTFEGKTIIPVIMALKERYQIEKCTIVADAGMLSEKNLEELQKNRLDYIVGARIGNMNPEEARRIANQLEKTDKRIIKSDTVLYEYSAARAKKDKADNDKAIAKAEYYLKHPSRVLKRSKFLASSGERDFALDEKLIEKHRLLEGIKGYRTNITDVPPDVLIARYRDLWKIEQSFRIAKSDLGERPIYHRMERPIKYHLLIVFVALCMTRVIEKEKGTSINHIVSELKDKWTITLNDEISGNSLNITLDKKPH